MFELFSRFVLICIACFVIASVSHAIRRAWRERGKSAREGSDGGFFASDGSAGSDCGDGGGDGGGGGD
ncbi:hypothetical protein V7S54_09500 [Ensifer sp. CCNWLY38]|uniref:hypothetical protein n=1 Tax=Ensifer sp. CCNWLW204 TaxID=3125799 RepID=UPI001146CC4A